MRSIEIAIVGTGHVGLVTGAAFAEKGHNVLCVDSNEDKIKHLSNHTVPIYEPGLEKLVRQNVAAKRLEFSTSIKSAIDFAKAIFICVPTPSLSSGVTDLTYIESVSREVARHLKSYRVIVDKSTVPVKTGEEVKKVIEKYARKGVEFEVASNPEFLREGQAVNDSLYPDRIVIGVEGKRAEAILREIYAPFNTTIIATDIKSAELIKHAANSFLALKISYANALSAICDIVGADVNEVTRGMGMDKRIGSQFLNAGLGYGGSCFPKDIRAFHAVSKQLGYDFSMLKQIEKINEEAKERFLEKVKKELWVIKDKVLACYGLAFKKNTDDCRESVALAVIKKLLAERAVIRSYDPKAMENAKKELQHKNITFCSSAYEAAKDADCLLILTDWDEFAKLDYKKIKKLMQSPTIIDGRNLLDPVKIRNLGFTYRGMGRP